MKLFSRIRPFSARMLLVFIVILECPLIFAKSLVLSVSETLSAHSPVIVARITQALKQTNYTIIVTSAPNKRSLLQVSKGEVAMDALRADVVIETVSDVIAIQPSVVSYTFKMVTSIETPEFCSLEEVDFAHTSTVGVLGFEVHRVFYSPKFGTYFEVSNAASAFKFIALQRADVLFAPVEALNLVDESIVRQLHFCDTHEKVFNFYTLLHRSYIWALPEIEASYERAFGKARSP